MAAGYTQFKGVSELGFSLVSDQLEANVTAFFDWSFLQVGGFFNVTFPAAGTRLRAVSDPGFDDDCVFEGYRQGWVWESGVPGVSRQPVPISGVWVDGVLNRGSGYHIDYPMGRVVFDVPPSGNVAVEHSFRRCRVETADAQWFQALQFDTLDFDAVGQAQFAQAGSGSWDVLSANRIQLPALVVEAVSRVNLTPLQLGSTARVHEQDVIFHVLAETPFDRKQLHDLVVNQWDHRIMLFDKNAVEDADAWPLDHRGSPRPSGLQYPQLVAESGDGGYRWRVCAITKVRSEPQYSYPPLYRATVRATFEVDLP